MVWREGLWIYSWIKAWWIEVEARQTGGIFDMGFCAAMGIGGFGEKDLVIIFERMNERK